jgi:hypothetical protein
MAYITEVENYDAGVYLIQATDPVQGNSGAGIGIANLQAQALADRTNWLKAQIAALTMDIAGLAPIASPVFTGSPEVPDAPYGDRSTLIANTEWVIGALTAGVHVNVNASGTTTLSAAQYGFGVLVLQGAITGDITVMFPVINGRWVIINNTTGAHNVFLSTTGQSGALPTSPQGSRQTYLAIDGVMGPELTPAQNQANPGHIILPGGLILCFGSVTLSSSQETVTINMDASFPNGMLTGLVTDGGTQGYPYGIYFVSGSEITVCCQLEQNITLFGATSLQPRGSATGHYFVIGY